MPNRNRLEAPILAPVNEWTEEGDMICCMLGIALAALTSAIFALRAALDYKAITSKLEHRIDRYKEKESELYEEIAELHKDIQELREENEKICNKKEEEIMDEIAKQRLKYLWKDTLDLEKQEASQNPAQG